MADAPLTRFARNGGVHLAFQVVGEAGPDLFLVDTWNHHVEAVWDLPDLARFLRRLSGFGRLIHFDRRGTGLSDPVSVESLPDLETQVDDALAVLDAAGSERAVVIGVNDGTLVAALLGARHPERCSSLVLFAVTAAHELAGGMPMETIDAVIRQITEGQAEGRSGVELLAPSRAQDERFSNGLLRLQRFSNRPGSVGHYYRQTMQADIRSVLPSIRVPTLVLNRAENLIVPLEQTEKAAALIPSSKLVVLPGTDHLPFSEDLDAVVDEIEEFVTGTRGGTDPDRVLATLLFTDIVDSTRTAARLGDRRWRDLLDEHHRLVRAQVDRFRGREISTTGDGFLLAFQTPARAVACAHAIVAAVAAAGLEVRAGVHSGEVEVQGADLGGLAVHIAARVAALASGGEVLVSSTVKELLAGSGFAFEERGEHVLKGVPDSWRLFAAHPRDVPASTTNLPPASRT